MGLPRIFLGADLFILSGTLLSAQTDLPCEPSTAVAKQSRTEMTYLAFLKDDERKGRGLRGGQAHYASRDKCRCVELRQSGPPQDQGRCSCVAGE